MTNGLVNIIYLLQDSCFGKCLKPSTRLKSVLLNCTTYNNFWISWDSHGVIVVGRGPRVSKDPLMTIRSTLPFTVNFLTLLGQNNPVHWRFIVGEYLQ